MSQNNFSIVVAKCLDFIAVELTSLRGRRHAIGSKVREDDDNSTVIVVAERYYVCHTCTKGVVEENVNSRLSSLHRFSPNKSSVHRVRCFHLLLMPNSHSVLSRFMPLLSPRAVSSHPMGGERPQSSRAPCLIANGG